MPGEAWHGLGIGYALLLPGRVECSNYCKYYAPANPYPRSVPERECRSGMPTDPSYDLDSTGPMPSIGLSDTETVDRVGKRPLVLQIPVA